MTPTRVLIADGTAIFRSGVRELLADEDDFSTAEASDLEELLAVAERERPDMALVDLDLPPHGGITAIRPLAALDSIQTIMWSVAPARETVLSAIRAGASGYLAKELSPRGLVRSLRGLRSGEAPLSRTLATRLIEALHALEKREDIKARADLLSYREREVLELVACGARNKEVARDLFISEFTVKRHVQNILEKLELRSRTAAAAFYRSVLEAESSAAVTTADGARPDRVSS